MKPWLESDSRTARARSWRICRARCSGGRRRSCSRWRSRICSSTSVSSSIAKGGTEALFRIRSSRALTSIVPVGRFALIVSSLRRSISPRTIRTHSERSAWARAWASGADSGRKTIWTSPVLSRRSTKIRPPWSRRRWTQPASTTSSPTREDITSPQRWLRRSDPMPSSSTPVVLIQAPDHAASGLRGCAVAR